MMQCVIPTLRMIFCALAVCAGSWAQIQTTTAIAGTVKDPTAAPMPGVNITVRNEETGAVRDTVTNEGGYYSVQALNPGRYSITASRDRFKTAVVQGRELQVSIPATVNFSMEVGELAQQVTVSAARRCGQPAVRTSSGAVGLDAGRAAAP